MSDLSSFFAQNAEQEEFEEVAVSERFKNSNGEAIKWKIRTMSEAENEEIRKSSTIVTKGKNGTRSSETKPEIYLGKLAASSVVFPNLKDAELQKSYGVLGEENLLKKMLLAGEYAALIQTVQSINGFDRDINEDVETVKN